MRLILGRGDGRSARRRTGQVIYAPLARSRTPSVSADLPSPPSAWGGKQGQTSPMAPSRENGSPIRRRPSLGNGQLPRAQPARRRQASGVRRQAADAGRRTAVRAPACSQGPGATPPADTAILRCPHLHRPQAPPRPPTRGAPFPVPSPVPSAPARPLGHPPAVRGRRPRRPPQSSTPRPPSRTAALPRVPLRQLEPRTDCIRPVPGVAPACPSRAHQPPYARHGSSFARTRTRPRSHKPCPALTKLPRRA